MLQIEYKIKLGQDEFTIRAEVLDEKDFFQKMSFYSNLPKVGPNGENDLKITHRTTTEGYNYYSLVSESAKQEYKFGQINEKDGGLYPKGWQPLYQGNKNETQGQTTGFQVGQQAAPVQTAPQVQQPPAFQPPQAPVQTQTYPNPTIGVTPPQVNPQFPGLVNPTTGPTAGSFAPPGFPSTATQPAAAPAAPAAPTQVSPQVAAAANNVLQRFGIQPKQ